MEIMTKQSLKAELESIISLYQKFVIKTNPLYYKQDADRANLIATNLRGFEDFIEKRVG